MNAPIVVAQANSSGSTTGAGSVRTIKVTKPTNEQAVTVQLGYDQAYKLDLSSIANEKITLVHIGEKLIILFENKSTVTVEPFFDSMNAPLSNVTVEANGRDFTGSEFASSFPITTDQSVLAAAGVAAAGTPSSGADFHGPSVDPLSEPRPLDLLGQEELQNWTTTPQLGLNLTTTTTSFVDTTPPTAAAGAFQADEKGLPGQEGEGGSSGVGSGEIADGNAFNNSDPSETTAGALSFSDSDGTAHISLVNGTPVIADGTVIVGAHGVLTINLDGTFTYTLTGNDLNHTSQGTGSDGQADVFTYTVEDSSGNTESSTLTIDILDDVPTARPDTDSIAAGETVTDGNVINGAGTDEGFNGAGHDTQGADGATVTGVVAGTNTTPVTSGAGLGGIAGSFGTLTLHADGSYEYARTPGTAGGGSDVFTYTLTDGDGDTSVTTLTISVGDNAPTLHVPSLQEPGTQVSEAGLPARGAEPAGSASASNSEITSGTIDFTSLDGVSSVEIDGVAVTPGSLPQTVVNDATGTLVINSYNFDAGTGVGSISYTYTLTDNTLSDPSSVSFAVAVTDADGDAVNNTLTIAIVDDAPLAVSDTDSLSNVTNTATGNVITAVDTTNSGADTVGADGAVVSAIQGNNPGGSGLTDVNGGVTIDGQFGTLTIAQDGSYTYTRTTADPLTATDVFSYTLKDGDGDTSTATLTININNGGVNISDLTPAANGGDASVNEANLSDGSLPNAAALTQTGTFTISTPDGLDDFTVGGHAVITNGVFQGGSLVTPLGNTITFTGFNPGSGVVTYTYTLTDNEAHAPIQGANDLFENFGVALTDIDGSTANDTLSVRIIDDVPTAVADTNWVKEGTNTVATGNVFQNIDHGGAPAGTFGDHADVGGADGIVTWDGAAGGSVTGLYGTVTVGGDGSYSYQLDSSNPAVQALTNGQTLQDPFTYTITDADGDTSTVVSTITVFGGNNGVTITDLTPQAQGGDASVNEANLADGSAPNLPALTQTGTFNVSAPDGLSSLTVDGHAVIAGGAFSATSFTTGLGNTLSFTGFNPATGVVTYSYTLLDNENHPTGNGVNSLFENFAVVLTDTDGSTAPDTLSVNIVDDVPTAHNDTDSVKEDGPLVADGNVITGIGGSDANATDGVADTAGADGIASIAWTGASGGAVAGSFGTLTVTGLGNYSYALNNSLAAVQHLSNGQTLTETFNYTITDADGDTSPASLTVTINGTDDGVTITNLTPAAQGGDVTVHEANLADGSAPNLPALTQTGTFNVSAPDGLSSLTVDGHAVITGGAFSATSFTTTLGNTLSFTGFNAATGQVTYSYTLLDNENHPTGNGANSLFENFAVQLKDLDGSTANDTLSVNIIDDVPAANAVTKSLVPAGHDTNLMLVLDVSGSMGDSSGLTGLTRLDVLKASVNELLEQYGNLGDVRVQIVTFSTNASQAGTDWMTLSQAKAAVAALSAGGNTNYDAAVTTAESIFNHSGQLATAGVQNVSYFMSDGVPNLPSGSVGVSASEEATWTTFLNTNHIDSFALGVGSGVTQSALDPLAFNGQTNTNTNSIVVTDLSQLTATLVGTIAGTGGNILTDGILPGSFGADGGQVQSISADGTTYTYDPANGGSIAVSGGANHGSFDTTTNTETVTLASGGVLTMIMDNGTFNYTAPANVTSGFTDTIPFVLIDNDGDTAGNNLQIVVSTQDHKPIVRDDHVITNAPSVSGPDAIVIPDWALLFNDSDPEGQTIAITAVSGATDGSVAHAGSLVTFTEESNNATDGGTFNYTGSANGLTNDGTVTVDRAQSGESTLDGTGLGDVLIGRDGNGSTINGNEGNDVLIGGNQGDILNGGTGNDLMAGGAGSDTYIVDSIGDQIIENANEGTDTVQASITFSLAAIANVENLTLTGSANINGTGNSLDNIIVGNTGNNSLDGGAGNDTITGAAGKDIMTGGAGSNTFVFTATGDSANTSANADVITDFVHGKDFIDLTAIDANTSNGGNQAFTFNGATPTAHGVWITEAGGNTLISMDTNGSSGSAEMMIVLTGINKGLTAADFHL